MHNRWHPDIPPAVTVAAGEELTLEANDGLDGQLTRESTHVQRELLNGEAEQRIGAEVAGFSDRQHAWG